MPAPYPCKIRGISQYRIERGIYIYTMPPPKSEGGGQIKYPCKNLIKIIKGD